jgi:5-methyltetrahydrofolate--homocysteine methyltransferase
MGRVPLLIGGATTSKMHTAVKIAPRYAQPTVHVLDASKSVVVVGSLLDQTVREEFLGDLQEEYDELRDTHYGGLKDRQYLSLAAARAHQCRIDFKRQLPVAPHVVGTHVVEATIPELLPYIDWKPFFEVWQLRGKYPNRGYPKIFNGVWARTRERARHVS